MVISFFVHPAYYHGSSGPMFVEDSRHHSVLRDAFLRAGRLLGFKELDQNAAAQTGFAPYQFNIGNGKRWTTAQAYLDTRVRLEKDKVSPVSVSIFSSCFYSGPTSTSLSTPTSTRSCSKTALTPARTPWFPVRMVSTWNETGSCTKSMPRKRSSCPAGP